MALYDRILNNNFQTVVRNLHDFLVLLGVKLELSLYSSVSPCCHIFSDLQLYWYSDSTVVIVSVTYSFIDHILVFIVL